MPENESYIIAAYVSTLLFWLVLIATFLIHRKKVRAEDLRQEK